MTKEKDKRTKEIVTRRWDRAELLKVPYVTPCPSTSATLADPETGYEYFCHFLLNICTEKSTESAWFAFVGDVQRVATVP